VRFRRPSWIRPVDSFGEWLGLTGGLLVVSAWIALIGAVAFGFTSVGRVGHALDRVTCGLDPTDSCNWSVVIVKNDTRATVLLEPCEHHGGKGDDCGPPIVVAPGATSSRDQYEGVQAITGLKTWVAVVQRGRRIGCLVLDGHSSKRDGDLVLVSEARRCGDSSSPATKVVGTA
jgi:hypothetical protein